MGGKTERSVAGNRVPTGAMVAAQVTDPCEMAEVRRYELAVEALCELVTETVPLLGKGDYRLQPNFMVRLAGISMAAWGDRLPDDMSRWIYPVRWSMFLWMCLSRILELTEQLAVSHPRAQWHQVHDTIISWRDSWGDDSRARYAQARFATLTGLAQGKEDRATFLHESLLKVLCDVQA
jgi:hypothetical protein